MGYRSASASYYNKRAQGKKTCSLYSRINFILRKKRLYFRIFSYIAKISKNKVNGKMTVTKNVVFFSTNMSQSVLDTVKNYISHLPTVSKARSIHFIFFITTAWNAFSKGFTFCYLADLPPLFVHQLQSSTTIV